MKEKEIAYPSYLIIIFGISFVIGILSIIGMIIFHNDPQSSLIVSSVGLVSWLTVSWTLFKGRKLSDESIDNDIKS